VSGMGVSPGSGSVIDHLDANSRRRGRSRSLGQVTGWWRLVGSVPGRSRCCTCLLYGARPCRGAAWPVYSSKEIEQVLAASSRNRRRCHRRAGYPSRQKVVSVGTSIVPPGPCPPPADTPGRATVVTTPQVTASMHDFAVSLGTRFAVSLGRGPARSSLKDLDPQVLTVAPIAHDPDSKSAQATLSARNCRHPSWSWFARPGHITSMTRSHERRR
jgi:hypothetical protein